jgi:tetratricopeptide (TPR) repeat protein
MSVILSLQVFYGCSTAPVKKGAVPVQDLICDKKADEALKDRRYEKSVILHEFYVKENPDNGLAMYHMGYSYGQLGEHENEVRCYEKAISLGFYGSGIFFNLGMVYGEMGRYDDAVKMFRKELELDPGDSDSIYQLGTLYLKTGQIEKAEDQLEKLMKVDPDGEMTLGLKNALENK